MATPVYVVTDSGPAPFISGLEALAAGGWAGYFFWHQLHPVFCILIGIGVFALYFGLFKYAFYLVLIPSMAIWGYLGFRLALHFAPFDNIWQITGAVIGAGLSCGEKFAFKDEA